MVKDVHSIGVRIKAKAMDLGKGLVEMGGDRGVREIRRQEREQSEYIVKSKTKLTNKNYVN